VATSKEYIEYVLECLNHIEGISARQMFGDYGLYMFKRVMGFVCDDQVFLKVLPGSTRVLGEDASTGEAYPGSKPYYIIEDLEDNEQMARLFRALYADVPDPKPKKPRGAKIA
jgi:TfoX/Sxy family transcriptional regulator of competence genes